LANEGPEDRAKKDKEAQRMEYIRTAQKGINEAQEAAEKDAVDNYNDLFTDKAQNDVVVLAEVAVQELNDENDKLLDEKAMREAEERKQYELHCREVQNMQIESKAELRHRTELLHKQVTRNEVISIDRTKTREWRMRNAFRSTGWKMTRDLEQAQGEVEGIYRGLAIADQKERHNLGGNLNESSDFDQTLHMRQLVDVRVEILRCVKDKLPKGRYVILCSILDQLGGNVVDDVGIRSKRGRITAPKAHNGEYHLNNLRFEESLLLVSPSRSDVRPSMAYLFELFLLKSKEYSHDQVLGWGVFPLINADFELNQGTFKVI
jgi:hypothetical protein